MESEPTEPLVVTQQEGHVLVIAINREAKRNAIDRATADALSAALDGLDDDPDLWVGILTGTSTGFSAGSDLTANGDYVTERGGEYGIIRRRRRKPLIAAVEGFALGGGMEIVLACDMVVAATNARFGLPEVRIGVVPTCAGLFRTPSALPRNLAREMVLTGAPIDAARAHAAGFVNVLAEPGGAVHAALELAERICANSPTAVQACLRAMDDVCAAGDDIGWTATRTAIDAIAGAEDTAEGVRAFFERRPPRWKGH